MRGRVRSASEVRQAAHSLMGCLIVVALHGCTTIGGGRSTLIKGLVTSDEIGEPQTRTFITC